MYPRTPMKLTIYLLSGVLFFFSLTGCGRKREGEVIESPSVPSSTEPAPAGLRNPPENLGAGEPAPPLSSPPPTSGVAASDRDLLESMPNGETLPATAVGASNSRPAAESKPGATTGYEAWFERYGLDLNDPKMLDSDADGDGYSNRDEFLVDTDPTDATSRPGFHPVMRLVSFEEVDLPMLVTAVNGRRATIRNGDTGETATVEKGDTIPGTDYVVDQVTEQVESDKFGEMADVSRVVGRDPTSGELINFMIGMRPRSQATSARLVSTQDPAVSVEIRQGREFDWTGAGGGRYLVVDLRPEQAVVKQLDTGDVFTVSLERPKR